MNEWILEPERLWSWPELQSQPVLPKKPGAYGWYFRALPSSVPLSACHSVGEWSLAYVGIACSRAGPFTSTQTLHRRIRAHFTGNAYGSTLRLSLGCLLANTLGIQLRRMGPSGTRLTFDLDEGEEKLSAWMAENARVVFIEHTQPRDLEKQLLSELNLPLNLDGNSENPFQVTLSQLRAEHRNQARSTSIIPGRKRARRVPSGK